MHLTKCYSAETSNCYSVSILPFFSRNRTQVLDRNIQLDTAMLISSGTWTQSRRVLGSALTGMNMLSPFPIFADVNTAIVK